MLHLKKNDTVKVLSGKDKGKTGKVLKIFLGTGRAIVQGVNFAKKHTKAVAYKDGKPHCPIQKSYIRCV